MQELPMTEVAQRPAEAVPGLGEPTSPAAERDARRELRRQIAGLEARLAELHGSAFPRQGIGWGIGAPGGPRMLGIGELERVRDALALRVRDAGRELESRIETEERNRDLLSDLVREPRRHRWVRVSNEDIGRPGCRHWHSRPRWGLLGMLCGWWRVKVSSGCPLAAGRGRAIPPLPDEPEEPQAPQASQGTDGGRCPVVLFP